MHYCTRTDCGSFRRIRSVRPVGFAPPGRKQPKDIRWGTGPVGSVGHKALVVLADLLNKEMPEYRITVLPMPGAVMTVKGFATNQIDAYYGSDDALQANSRATPAASRASRQA